MALARATTAGSCTRYALPSWRNQTSGPLLFRSCLAVAMSASLPLMIVVSPSRIARPLRAPESVSMCTWWPEKPASTGGGGGGAGGAGGGGAGGAGGAGGGGGTRYRADGDGSATGAGDVVGAGDAAGAGCTTGAGACAAWAWLAGASAPPAVTR